MTKIINLTPHPITVGTLTIESSGIARAGEYVASADPIVLEDGTQMPTSWVTYTRVDDLPAPQTGVYYVVSMVAAQAAAATHRSTDDLLTPGEQVRDDSGRIVGCRSLARFGRGIAVCRWRDQRDQFVAASIAQGGSGDVSAEREASSLGRYARNYSRKTWRPGDKATFYLSTRNGRGVHLTGVPFGTHEEQDAAYALLASAGARCNDASDEEKRIADEIAPPRRV